MMRFFTFCLFFVILLPTNAFPQGLLMRLGDKHFEELNFSRAVDYYEGAIKRHPKSVHLQRRLAQTYDKMRKFEKADKYFKLLMKNYSHVAWDGVLYARFLIRRGKYQNAKIYLQDYLKKFPEEKRLNALKKELDRLLAESLTEMHCKVEGMAINSSYSDFGPVIYKDRLVFTSARKSRTVRDDFTYGWDGQYFLELFQCGISESNSSVTRFGNGMGSRFHEGAICFSSDSKTMYFTRSNFSDGKLRRSKKGFNNLNIFIAKAIGGKWEITGEFPYNSDEYSVGHPCLSPNETDLYIVSDKFGGFGGTDIYRCRKVEGKWSKPVNLGEKVNTSGDEMFPFISEKGVLFFSSNGHPGMGSLDLYGMDLQNPNAQLVHFGAPMNSIDDDFSLTLKASGREGFFASNREGGKGEDDLYSFEISSKNEVKIHLVDRLTGEFLDPNSLSLDGVEYLDDSSQTEKGKLKLVLEREQTYRLVVEKDNYYPLDTLIYCGLMDPVKIINLFLVRKPTTTKSLVNIQIRDYISEKVLMPDILEIKEPEFFDISAQENGGKYHVELLRNHSHLVYARKEGYYPLDTSFYCNVSDSVVSHQFFLMKQPAGDGALVQIQVGEAYQNNLIVPDVLQIIEPEIIDLHPEEGNGKYGVELTRGKEYRIFARKKGFYAIDTSFYLGMEDRHLFRKIELHQLSAEEAKSEMLPEELALIYFDFDRYNLRVESLGVIGDVVDLMNENENLMLTLVARTDTRGSEAYNQELSFRRAYQTREIFYKKGIAKKRVIILALGEAEQFEQLKGQTLDDWYQMNRCVDFEFNTFLPKENANKHMEDQLSVSEDNAE